MVIYFGNKNTKFFSPQCFHIIRRLVSWNYKICGLVQYSLHTYCFLAFNSDVHEIHLQFQNKVLSRGAIDSRLGISFTNNRSREWAWNINPHSSKTSRWCNTFFRVDATTIIRFTSMPVSVGWRSLTINPRKRPGIICVVSVQPVFVWYFTKGRCCMCLKKDWERIL